MAPTTIVLITGANGGVGSATAKVLLSSSAKKYHVIVSARTLEKAQKTVAELQGSGAMQQGTASALQLDQTDGASIRRAVEAVDAQFQRLDVLVNNAAVAYPKDAHGNLDAGADATAAFRAVLETNVLGPHAVSRAFRPLLDRAAAPRSVYLSTMAGSLAKTPEIADGYQALGETALPYAVSKAALNMLGVVEKAVFYQSKVKVFSFCPGYVVSNLRGAGEDARTGWGAAGDPDVSGRSLLEIIEGRRDADEGKGILHKDGVYPW